MVEFRVEVEGLKFSVSDSGGARPVSCSMVCDGPA